MLFTLLLALTGITLSAVAIYYSVLGLTAIFAAAFWPIVIMGSTLEVAKIVAVSWLKWHWSKIPFIMKSYMTLSVFVLMVITSMGIFGFLSKAHLDQTVPTGDIASQVALIDQKIANERDTIANARTLLGQLDKTVSDISSGPGREIRQRDGSVTIENPAERALAIRRSQVKDRDLLTKTIEAAQAKIVKLQEEKAPIAGQLRAAEAEVGPIKYIARLIYNTTPDHNILEKAVTWVIITIILVFDPLAILLILASQMNYQWWRQSKEQKNELVQENTTSTDAGKETPTETQSNESTQERGVQTGAAAATVELGEKELEPIKQISAENNSAETVAKSDLEQWNKMLEEAEKAAKEEKERSSADVEWTDNLKVWKEQNPDVDIFEMKRKFDAGEIDRLPWDVVEEIEDRKLRSKNQKKRLPI